MTNTMNNQLNSIQNQNSSSFRSSQLAQECHQNNNGTATTNNSGYTGSSFACLLVLILFIIWGLYRFGCFKNS